MNNECISYNICVKVVIHSISAFSEDTFVLVWLRTANCQGIPLKCRRRKRSVTYFEGSFKQTIDVWAVCKKLLSVVNKRATFEDPY